MKIKLIVLAAILSVPFLLQISIEANAEQELPGIYLSRVVDRAPVIVPGLKSQYKVCADQRSLYKRLFDQGGVGWAAMKDTLPAGYNIKAATAPEPDWEGQKVGQQFEREYMQGDKYALYRVAFNYEISDVKSCKLSKREDLEIELDNGRERYLITLKDKINASAVPGVSDLPLKKQYKSHRVKKLRGAAMSRKEHQQALDEIGKDERLAHLLSLLIADKKSSRLTGVNVSFNSEIADEIKKAMGYEEDNYSKTAMPKSNDEHLVAGQPCDIINAENMSTRLWYWDEMHYYPGLIERPIILKEEHKNRKDKVVALNEAKEFRLVSHIDDSVFEPQAGLLK
jgi:hypothetical protein